VKPVRTMKKKPPSTSDNHAKAPLSAAFVNAMRDVFGADQVTVLYVNENEVRIGKCSTPAT
jgi:hypothetical protein